MKRRGGVFVLAIFIVVLVLCSTPSFGQGGAATLSGRITDQNGLVIPGAKVQAVKVDTNTVFPTDTNDAGLYNLPTLPPGTYRIVVEKEGFEQTVQSGIELHVADSVAMNFALKVGSISQSVTVTGEAPIVNTTTSSLGGLVNDKQIVELPLNGRNYVDLTLLQPGVSEQHNSGKNGGGAAGISGTWFSANGAPVRSNNYTLDGAMMVNAYGASTASQAGTTLGVDGIQEYKIITGNFSAEYGMAMGSQMVIVSKGGTNRWSGDVFEYLRNSALDARNFFDSSASSGGRRLPEFQRNNFGGSFGGPIKRDKTFFYAVYEGLRQNLGITINDTVMPVACHSIVADGSGNYKFPDLASAQACQVSLTDATVIPAVIKPFLDLYPNPTNGVQFSTPAANRQHVNFGQIRVDQVFSGTDSLFGRYTIDDGGFDNNSNFPQVWNVIGQSRDQFLTLSETHVFSNALLNTARVSYSRTSFDDDNIFVQNFVDPQYSMVEGQPLGYIGVSGLSGMGPINNFPTVHVQNIYTGSDDLFYTRGRHALKFGVLFNRFNSATRHSKLLEGLMSYSNLQSFMQGKYASYTSLTPGADLGRDFIYNTFGAYIQDDLRLTPRFTVNAGLRYEIQTVPYDLNGKQSRFLNFTDPAQTWTYGPVMRNPGYKNFSPRVGFAWDVFGKGKTSIRSGFGLYYDIGNIGSALQQQPNAMPPYSLQLQVNSNPSNQVISLPLDYTTNPGSVSVGGLQSMDYNIKQPQALEYNFTIDQQLPLGIGLAVSYVGLQGRHLWVTIEANPFTPQVSNGIKTWNPYTCNGILSPVTCSSGQTQASNPNYQRLNPAWASTILTTTRSNSSYNSLQVLVNKRLSRGLQFQSAYTWSKSLDTTQGQMFASDCSGSGTLLGTDPFDPQNDKGPSCFDVTHNWNFSLLYHVPSLMSDNFAAKLLRGWWVGNIVTVQSGYAFTPLLSVVNRSNSGVFSASGIPVDRVDLGTDTTTLVKNGITYNFVPFDPSNVIMGDPNHWFNPLMFRLGPTGSLGNASRNMLRGPGLGTWNISINKDTKASFLGESGVIQFRAELFNVLNRANFNLPSGSVFTGTVTDPAGASEPPIGSSASNPLGTVGRITSTATTSRQIQLALKLIF
jgi:hypothetical protein